MSSAFRITLRCIGDYDAFKARQFDLFLDKSFSIGRSSKNSSKPELMAAAHNAYIDSPVVSREHAKLLTNTSSGIPQVYIEDCDSMHGTLLNNRKLVPHMLVLLHDGDTLQLGSDVNRNDESFIARQYKLIITRSNSFSQGFSVPEAADDIEALDMYGRDDSDAVTENSDDEDMAEIEGFCQEMSGVVQEMVVHKNSRPISTMDKNDENLESDARYSCCAEESEEDCVDDSEHNHDLNGEEYASEEDESIPSSLRQDEGQLFSSVVQVASSPDNSPVQAVEELLSCNGLFEEQAMPIVHETAPYSPYTHPSQLSTRGSEHGSEYVPFAELLPPPLPPRPLPVPTLHSVPQMKTPISQSNEDKVAYLEDRSNSSIRLPSFEEEALSSVPMPGTAQYSNSVAYNMWQLQDYCISPPVALPPTPPAVIDTSTANNTPLPARRTKVSIEEIVEEQSPKPTRVNKLKRKADILEEKENHDTPETSVEPQASTVDTATQASDAAPQTTAKTQQVAVLARPVKKPRRSLFKKALKVASWSSLGAAGTVIALSTLPDSFFGA